MTTDGAMAGYEPAKRQVLRVEELLACSQGQVWRALTDSELIGRWLMPNEFRLAIGHRFEMDSDPIRRSGMGGTGYCEVLAFDAPKMLRITWTAAADFMRDMDSVITFTTAAEGASTRLLVEHDGMHPTSHAVTGVDCGSHGGHSTTRHIGAAADTTDAWRAALRRIPRALAGLAAETR